MASAGTVTLNLDANSVKMIRELQKAQRTTKRSSARMRKDFVRAFKGISVAAGAAAASMALMTKKAVDFADSIGKTADRIGVSTDALQEFRFAAEQSGVDLGQFEQALTALVRRQGEAIAGNKGFAEGFERLGIAVEELRGMKAEDLMNRIADGLQRLPDQAARIAALDRVMSEAGRRIINVFGDGAESLQQFRTQAQELGIVMDERLIRQAEEVSDKMNILSKVISVRLSSALLELSPAIVAVSEGLTDTASATGDFTDEAQTGAEKVINAFAFIMDAAAGVERTFQVWGRTLAVTFASIELGLLQLSNSIVNGPGAAIDWLLRKADQVPGVEIDFQFGPAMPQIQASMDRAEGIVREGMADIHEIMMQPLPGDDLLARFEAVRARMETEAAKPPPIVVPGASGTDGAAGEANDAFLEQQRRAAEIVARTRTDFEQYVVKLNEAHQLWNTFDEQGNRLLNTEAYWRYVAELEEGLVQVEDKAEESFNALDEFANQAARNMQDALAQFLFDPFQDGLGGMLKGFLNTMRQMVAEIAAQQILKSLFGGFAGSDNGFLSALGGAFGGGKAAGGPVSSSKTYLVGERGPELFTPSTSGNIIPNHAMGGNVTVNVDARQSDDPARLLALAPVIANQVEQSISLKMRRGYL